MDFDRRPSIPARRRIRARDKEEAREALKWAVEHRGRPPAPPMPSAGRAAGKALRPLAKAFGPSAGELERHWPEIVGEHLARWTRPERFQSGALVVRARGPAAALIEAQSARILDRVEQYAGRRPRRLKIMQGGLAGGEKIQPKTARVRPAAAEAELEGDDAERLKALLARWGDEVAAREGR